MLRWLKRQYITYLLLYVAILFVVVFLVLFGIFKLLPSEGVFSVEINRTKFAQLLNFPNVEMGGFSAKFYGDSITLGLNQFISIDLHSNSGEDFILTDKFSRTILDDRVHIQTEHPRVTGFNNGTIRFTTGNEFANTTTANQNQSSIASPLLSIPGGGVSFTMKSATLFLARFTQVTEIRLWEEEQFSDSGIIFMSVAGDTDILFTPSSQFLAAFFPIYAVSSASEDEEGYYRMRIQKIHVPSSGATINLYIGDIGEKEPNSYSTDRYISFKFDEAGTDYEITAPYFFGNATVTGDGTLYYSSYTSTKEYPLHMQDVQLNEAVANLSIQKDGENTSIKLHGSADDVLRSGVSIKPSIINWISESIAILPTFLLTVFGGAITISLKMWDKAKTKANAAKPEACHCEPAPQRWRGNPYSRRPASIYTRRKARADREKRIATSADASSQ